MAAVYVRSNPVRFSDPTGFDAVTLLEEEQKSSLSSQHGTASEEAEQRSIPEEHPPNASMASAPPTPPPPSEQSMGFGRLTDCKSLRCHTSYPAATRPPTWNELKRAPGALAAGARDVTVGMGKFGKEMLITVLQGAAAYEGSSIVGSHYGVPGPAETIERLEEIKPTPQNAGEEIGQRVVGPILMTEFLGMALTEVQTGGLELAEGAAVKGARGPASGRPFDPRAAGGPIRELTTQGVRITPRGINAVEEHLARFGFDKANAGMIARLKKIASGEVEATSSDLNFYTHELRESVRYRNLGYRTGMPADADAAHDLWNNAHTATLEDYGLKEGKGVLYHPDVAR